MNAPSCRCLGRCLILAVPLFTGCGLRHYQRELLERDLRWQEDELYRLTAAVEDLQDQLDAARRENEVLREEDRSAATAEGISTPRGEPRTDLPLVAPEIDLGTPSADGGETLRRPSTWDHAPRYEGPPEIEPLPGEAPDSFPAENDSLSTEPTAHVPRTWPQVSNITLNRFLTGGHNKDGRFGDEGLLVVVEPRDVTGQVVPVPGQISFVLLDPACQGKAARVARWDFAEAEVLRRFKQGVFGKGMRFELPWPNQPPQHDQLKLFVRMTLPDGQQLTADKAVAVDLRARGSCEWAAVPAGRGALASATDDNAPDNVLLTGDAPQDSSSGSLAGDSTSVADGWSAGEPLPLDHYGNHHLPVTSAHVEMMAEAAPGAIDDSDPSTVVYEPEVGSADQTPWSGMQTETSAATNYAEPVAGEAAQTAEDDGRSVGTEKRRRLGSPTAETPGPEDQRVRDRRGWAPYR